MLGFALDVRPDRAKPLLLRDLTKFLVAERRVGRRALLVIDEAPNLEAPALDEIRAIAELKADEAPLIHLVLAGQPGLRGKLDLPALQELRQRASHHHLLPLGPDDTAAYINHRLRRASLGEPVEFPRAVCDLVCEHSRGLPRKINVIAERVRREATYDRRSGRSPCDREPRRERRGRDTGRPDVARSIHISGGSTVDITYQRSIRSRHENPAPGWKRGLAGCSGETSRHDAGRHEPSH
jgi:hypothetical protein